MKIIMLINSFQSGGAEKLTYDLVASMINNGEKVFIISVAPILLQIEIENEKMMKNAGATTYSLERMPKQNRIQTVRKLVKILRDIDADILQAQGQSPAFYGRIAKLFIPKIKVIYTIHNTSGYNKIVEKILGWDTDAYTAVSIQTKEYAIGKLKIKKEIKVIYNGINIKRYNNNDIKNDYKLHNPFILSVGRVTRQKGYMEAMLSVCSFLESNNYKWYILGDYNFDIGYYNELVSIIPYSLKNRIIFTGVVTNTEMYYKQASCFLFPSLYEGFGIACIEAMAAGLPIICTKVGIIPELLKMGAEMKVFSIYNDIQKFLDTVCSQNYNNETLKVNYKIVEEFSISNLSDQYLALYNRILN